MAKALHCEFHSDFFQYQMGSFTSQGNSVLYKLPETLLPDQKFRNLDTMAMGCLISRCLQAMEAKAEKLCCKRQGRIELGF